MPLSRLTSPGGSNADVSAHATMIVVGPAGKRRAREPRRFGLLECDAIVAGVRAAEAALDRANGCGVLRLFADADRKPYDDRGLEVLRAYAEMRRALFRRFRNIPADCLVWAGYSRQQIVRVDALIDALAAGVSHGTS